MVNGRRTCTYGDWGVSCTTGSGINGAILHIYRARIGKIDLPVSKWLKGYGDGRLFESTDAAWDWAFSHGYLKLYFTSSHLRARAKSRAINPNEKCAVCAKARWEHGFDVSGETCGHWTV